MANTLLNINPKKKTVNNFNIQFKAETANIILLLFAFYYLKRQQDLLPIKFVEERNLPVCHSPERNISQPSNTVMANAFPTAQSDQPFQETLATSILRLNTQHKTSVVRIHAASLLIATFSWWLSCSLDEARLIKKDGKMR